MRLLLAVCLLATTAAAQVPHVRPACPPPTTIAGVRALVFPDGSIAMRRPLEVNPDGSAASYTAGDHGFAYVANAIALWRRGARESCTARLVECSRTFRAAEAAGFGPGTQEFCAFAIAVEPPPGGQPTPCPGGHLVGNGKGKPRIGRALATVTGASIDAYVPRTALRHTIEDTPSPIDASRVPSLVVPAGEASGLGQVAWARWTENPTNEVFAVAGDVGPGFGAGSIALHQLLRYGRLAPQKIGPIPMEQRCGDAERGLLAPFLSRPDVRGDVCRPGGTPRGATDIRAYEGIPTPVDLVLLGRARFDHPGDVVAETLDAGVIRQKATAAGYTAASIEAMADCLDER